MPTYEYACTACGERTEAKQGFDDPPLDTCSSCGGKLRKLYSPVGIVFKGSGFYATDSKKSKSSSSSSRAGDSKDRSEKGSTTASEGKSDGGTSGSTSKETSKP